MWARWRVRQMHANRSKAKSCLLRGIITTIIIVITATIIIMLITINSHNDKK